MSSPCLTGRLCPSLHHAPVPLRDRNDRQAQQQGERRGLQHPPTPRGLHLPADAGGVPTDRQVFTLRAPLLRGLGQWSGPWVADQAPGVPLAAPVQGPAVDADQARGANQAETEARRGA